MASTESQTQILDAAAMRAQGDLAVPDPASPNFAIDTPRHYRRNKVESLLNWAVAAGIYARVKDVPDSNKPAHYFRRYRVPAPAAAANRLRTATALTGSEAMTDREDVKEVREWSDFTSSLRGRLKRLFFGSLPPPSKKRKRSHVKDHLFTKEQVTAVVQQHPADFGVDLVPLEMLQYPCPFIDIVRKTTKAYCLKCGGYQTLSGTKVSGFGRFGARKQTLCNFTPRQRTKTGLLQRCRECAQSGHEGDRECNIPNQLQKNRVLLARKVARARAFANGQDWIEVGTLSPINKELAPVFARFADLQSSEQTQAARVAVGHAGHLAVGRVLSPAQVLSRLNQYLRNSRVIWASAGAYKLRSASVSHVPNALLTVCAGVWITTEKTDDPACSVSETHKTVVQILRSGRLRYYPFGRATVRIENDKFVVTRISRLPKLEANSLHVVGKLGDRSLVVRGTGGTKSLHEWRLTIGKSTDTYLLFRKRARGLRTEQYKKKAQLCTRSWGRWLVNSHAVDTCEYVNNLHLCLASLTGRVRPQIIMRLLLYYDSVSAYRFSDWNTIEYQRCSWDTCTQTIEFVDSEDDINEDNRGGIERVTAMMNTPASHNEGFSDFQDFHQS